MRIIDADKLKDDIDYYIKEAEWGEEANKHLEWCKEFIDSQPTIDAKPVIRGRWKIWDEDYGDTFECSECGEVFYLVDGTPKENHYNRCPNCGALLDGEVEQ